MRIIAGKLGARQFHAPKGHRTHPMSDKVRGALFSMLGDVGGLSVLDAFAGSGALGFEAISRGAAHATLLEIDKQAHHLIMENIELLGLDEHVVAIRAPANSWSENNPGLFFDLILCDPPYNHLQQTTLQKLVEHLAPGGLYVLSWPGKQPAPALSGLKIIANRTYGDAQLAIYQ